MSAGTPISATRTYGIRLASDSNLVGGTAPGDRNVISGNDIDGIRVQASTGNVIQGNYIGTNAAGTGAVGNTEDGIWLDDASDTLIGGVNPGERNVISGNGWAGIGVTGGGTGNVVQGNYIGVDASGSAAAGQPHARHRDLRLGRHADRRVRAAGAGNVIAHNWEDGVAIVSGTGHSVLGNSIFANGRLGIDIGDDGVTANDPGDADLGTNYGMNAPVIYSMVVAGRTVTITGEAQPAPRWSSSRPTPPAGPAQGEILIGSGVVGGVVPGQSTRPHVQFSFSFAAGSLTARRPGHGHRHRRCGNTSEFGGEANVAPDGVALSNSSVDENIDTSGGYTVGTLSASDLDAGDSHTYSIVGGSDGSLFGVSGDQLRIDDGVLDYEWQASYEVVVRATDSGGLFFDQTLVIDVNDIATTIAAGQTFGIGELAANSDPVGTLATSGDVAVSFTIVSGDPSAAFTIDANGAITVDDNSALDFETTPSYTLTIEADDGTTVTSQTVTINVSDAGPSLPAGQTFAVSEAAGNGDPLGIVVSAGDAPVSFTITAGNGGGVFAIDSFGEITVADASGIDYESATSFTLTVEVSDGTSAVSQDVTILVTDVSDVPVGPVGDVNLASNEVTENAAAGTTVGVTALATDPETADTVSYSLDDDAGGRFAIDPLTGVVTLAGALDYEAAASHIIVVRATSSDASFSTAAVAIPVGDVNELPTISAIADQAIAEDGSTGPLTFTISDPETAPATLIVAASSSNTALIPNGNLVLGGSGGTRTITVTPAANAYGGPVTITLSVSDGVNLTSRPSP